MLRRITRKLVYQIVMESQGRVGHVLDRGAKVHSLTCCGYSDCFLGRQLTRLLV
jgi:hypothetical protein